jgi:hypothetical protein
MKIFAAILIACLPAICLQDTEFTNLQRAFCVLSTPTPPPDPSPVPRLTPVSTLTPPDAVQFEAPPERLPVGEVLRLMITGLSQEVAQKSTTTCWPQKGVFANFSLTIEEKPQAQLIFRATTAGEYQVGIQYPGPGGSVAKAEQIIVVGDQVPPTPPVPPVPPPEPPIAPTALKVLIVYDTTDVKALEDNPSLTDDSIRDYLKKHCVDDGGVPAYRMWGTDVDLSASCDPWRKMYAVTVGKKPPYAVIVGIKTWDGPWPPKTDDALRLLKQYGGD